MTERELNKFARACTKDGRPEAIELAREALRRLRERT